MCSARRVFPSSSLRHVPPWRLWLGTLLLSLLIHAWLLAPAGLPPGQRPRATAAPLQTRSVVPAPATTTPTAASPTIPAPTPPAAPVRSADFAKPPAAEATSERAEWPGDASELPPPAAQPAPAAEWLYRLEQNGRQGLARLIWQPLAGGYRLRLERELDARPLPGWRSEGAAGAQGLAPQRYAQQRLGRQGWQDTQATNFRRDEGTISFSASAQQVALPSGVQDRISGWLQLAAQVAGAPQRFGPGSELRLPVAGLRGEVREWSFDVLGEDSLSLPIGVVTALHLRRAPLGPYDGELEIWLDPARAHLPVRIHSPQADGRGWDLQLLDDKAKP